MANEKIVVLTNQKSERLSDVTKTLGLADYQVSVVSTKEDLLDYVKFAQPVLIIKDILSIAVCDVETIRHLSNDESFGSIPILLIGDASQTSVNVIEALNAGAAGYLKLRVEPLILVKKITQLIERKRNEKIIGNQENYLRALIENGTDIITVITTEGKIIYESPSIEHNLGYKSNELIGRNCLEFVHSNDRMMLSEYYRESVRQNGFTQSPLKYRFKHKNGSWRVLESVSNFVKDNLEELVIVVNSRDITRRRSEEKAKQRLENKLFEAEHRFKLALQTARMIWWEWNPRRDEITVADNFTEVYGAPGLKNATDGFSLLHPDDEERHTNLVRKIAAEGGSYHSEFKIIRQDNGETVWIEESATAFLDDHGAVQKITGISIDITQRKNSENAVRQSEERSKTQYKELPVPAYTWKKSGDDFILEDFNDIADSLAQHKMREYLGMTELQVFPDLPKLRDGIEQCYQEQKSHSFEIAYVSRITNETKQLVFNFVFIAPDSVMIYTLDVTEYRQTIDSLKASENRFSLVSRATNDVLWDWNLTNDDLWWNENVYRVFGYQKEEVSSKINFWFENIHPADAERVISGIKKIIENKESDFWSAEYRFRQGNNSYAYVLDRGHIERDETGKAVRMIGAMMNMTRRKWAEIELIESKERLALAQQVANIGSFDWNIQTGKLITSKQLENIYGADENFNNDFDYWRKFIHPDDVELAQKSVERAYLDGEVNYEFRIFSADGKSHWLYCSLKVFYDENNQPERVIGVNMDVTQRKFAEEALRKSQEQLAQSQKLESIGRLAGGIAHDFNNMLTAINGYSELVLRNLKEDDPNRRKVLEIKKAGDRSVDLTKQLLAFSRRQVLQPKLVDLNQVVADMSQLLKRLIGEHIQLNIDLHKDACCILADPGQLSQVIMNLVVNARDAMPEGGKLKIETVKTAVDEIYVVNHAPMVPGEYIMLYVSDTGSGIDEKTMHYIFEPFFTTKKSGSGTGLGLATVYGIIKQSGGYIWVESEIGKGTNFKVFLPYITSTVQTEETEVSEPRALMGTETILFVEDEETVRNLTRQVLENYGYKVIVAQNGIEALKICQNEKPKIDLLLTDVVMPKMSGHKLANTIAILYPHLKIIFTSGYTDDKTLLDDLEGFEKDFIQKPFTADSLGNKVRNLLDRKNS